MSAPALKALAAAKTAGVKITLDGDGLILEANPLPSGHRRPAQDGQARSPARPGGPGSRPSRA